MIISFTPLLHETRIALCALRYDLKKDEVDFYKKYYLCFSDCIGKLPFAKTTELALHEGIMMQFFFSDEAEMFHTWGEESRNVDIPYQLDCIENYYSQHPIERATLRQLAEQLVRDLATCSQYINTDTQATMYASMKDNLAPWLKQLNVSAPWSDTAQKDKNN